MARKKHRKNGPGQQRRATRSLHAVPDPRPEVGSGAANERGGESGGQSEPEILELSQVLRQALRSDQPLELLLVLSQMVNAVDPRGKHPALPGDEPAPRLEDVVESFAMADVAETTAALTVLQAIVADELLAARIRKVLARRRQPMPHWLRQLAAPHVSRVVKVEHVLRDGDDFFLDTTLPTGESLTALVYIDHNLGTVVKDAFLIPAATDAVLALSRESLPAEESTTAEVDLADARATIEAAIRKGAMTFPPIESDDWPMTRPLVEWLVRSLPTGGRAEKWPEWSDKELAALHEDFWASPYAENLDHPEERELLSHITWFASQWTGGDPLRWSPVNVEIILADWFPRMVSGNPAPNPASLLRVPDLLRGFVRYCHARREIPAGLTQEALEAVAEWQPVFEEEVRSSHGRRPDSLNQLLAGRLAEPYGPAWMLAYYEQLVGGPGPLLNVDADPLPDEAFDWSGVPEDIRPRVQEVLDLCDGCAERLFDVEHRTAFRRFLARAAVGDPGIFRRRGTAHRAAAAVCWAVAKANFSIVYTGARIEVGALLDWFGIKGSVSDRAGVFLAAVGADARQSGELTLGSADFLVSRRREEIVQGRDRFSAEGRDAR